VPNHQLQRVRRSLLYRETKTEASDAWLPMPDIVAAALRIRRGQQDEEREAAGEIWQQTNAMPSLIFTGRYGTPIDPRTLNRKFTARCDAAGVRRLTVHDARHTCATLLVDLDVHPRVIMRILRHADQAVTMEIYANASSAATREALPSCCTDLLAIARNEASWTVAIITHLPTPNPAASCQPAFAACRLRAGSRSLNSSLPSAAQERGLGSMTVTAVPARSDATSSASRPRFTGAITVISSQSLARSAFVCDPAPPSMYLELPTVIGVRMVGTAVLAATALASPTPAAGIEDRADAVGCIDRRHEKSTARPIDHQRQHLRPILNPAILALSGRSSNCGRAEAGQNGW
jgi:hypothetical protein